MKILIGILVLCCLALGATSQSMTVADSAYLANLRTQLVLTNSQFDTIQTVYLKSQNEIGAIDKELRIISRSDMADSLKS